MARSLLADPWVRGCAALGALLAAAHAVVGLPWLLWLAWAWLAGISAYDACCGATRDATHSGARPELWQTRPDE